MDLANLLVLVPPAVALAWLAHLLFRKELAKESLGKIISYFIGVLIIFLAIAWIVDSFFIPWVNARLINASNSTDLQQSILIIETVIDDSFTSTGTGNTLVPTPGPTPIIIYVTPVPTNPGGGGGGAAQPTTGEWPKQHMVQPGDTLSSIGQQYGVPYEAIMQANGLDNWTIFPGQTLLIPAPTK